MDGRNISGIMDWMRVDVVPMVSLQVVVAVAIAEKGQIWASGLRFAETNHPTTGVKVIQDRPTTLTSPSSGRGRRWIIVNIIILGRQIVSQFPL